MFPEVILFHFGPAKYEDIKGTSTDLRETTSVMDYHCHGPKPTLGA